MLKITIIILESLFSSIYNSTIRIANSLLQHFLIGCQTSPVNPMQGDISHIGSGPFGRITTFSFHPFQCSMFKIGRNMLFSRAHLNQKNPYPLWFGYLIVPPVTTIRIAPVPIFKCSHNLTIQCFLPIVLILRICIGKNKIIDTVNVNQRFPVCTIRTTIIYICE